MASNVPENEDEMMGYGELIKQWVSLVTGYSSQYDESGWCARQVIGPPKVYPHYGDNAGAWAMADCSANEFLELEFQDALFVHGLDIYETYHAGGVKAILGKDPAGKWKQLWKTEQVQVIHNSRIFSPPLQKLGFPIKHIRIEVDCSGCGTWVEIDAVEMKGKKHMLKPPPSLNVLAEDYRKLVNDASFSDIGFTVEGKTVHAHKVILSARSDYFRTMLSDMPGPENYKSLASIPDVSYQSFIGMMHYIYCNSVPSDFNGVSLTELWRVADKYGMDGMKNYASFTIMNKLDATNVVDIYVDAVKKLPVIEEVKKNCLNYMALNMDKVVTTKSFSALPQDLMLEIIQSTTAKLSI